MRRLLAVCAVATAAAASTAAGKPSDARQAAAPPNSVTEPFAVVIDPRSPGFLLVADRVAGLLRLDTATGRATEIGDVHEPLDVAVGPDGAVYAVSDYRVVRVDAAGRATTVAGTGENRYGGDGGPASRAQLFSPDSLGFDAAGNLYVAEYENRIRKVDAATGTIATVAGTGAAGFAGDGRVATRARLHHPHGLAVARDGTLFVADTANHRIRRVDGRTGFIRTIAGTGLPGFSGDGGRATRARLQTPAHVAIGPRGTLYVSDAGNERVRRIGAGGIIRTIAGNGLPGSGGDGGPATRARLALPNQTAVAADGTVYVAEFTGRRVRRIDRTGRITTLAR